MRVKKNVLSSRSATSIIALLWACIFLSLLALCFSWHARSEIRLSKYFLGQIRSKYLAWQGVSLGSRQIYKGGPLNEESFVDPSVRYSLRDEGGLLNINAINEWNMNIFLSFFELLGVERQRSLMLVYALIDWIDHDETLSHELYGAEDAYYLSLEKPYACKDLPFDSKEELLLVRGITQEIFDQMKEHISIWPKNGTLRMNWETAPEIVLRALAHSYARENPLGIKQDADSLVDKILHYRRGKSISLDLEEGEKIDIRSLSLTPQERGIVSFMEKYRSFESRYFTIRSYARDISGIKSQIEAVVDKDDLSIVSWRRK